MSVIIIPPLSTDNTNPLNQKGIGGNDGDDDESKTILIAVAVTLSILLVCVIIGAYFYVKHWKVGLEKELAEMNEKKQKKEKEKGEKIAWIRHF